uniref:Uncharacterized protein n=1 Tax=Oryza sativa subsp. japonica TaxID=39947 RepID=Q6YTS3_ORYSJ|nr:unknown protein [Oryza sativa Japonica Group]
MAHKRGRLVGWVLLLLLAVAIAGAAAATPRQLFLVTQAPVTLTNHHGQLLTGNYSVNLLWYGRFTPAQRATVADFLLSMSRRHRLASRDARARQVRVRVGGERGGAVPGGVRVAVPPAGVRPSGAAAGVAERRRGDGRHHHQPRHAARRGGDEPVRRRVLPGPHRGAAGGGDGLHGDVRRRRLPGVPRPAAGGRRHRRQLQRRRGRRPAVPPAGDVGPQDLAVLYSRVVVLVQTL